MTNLARRIGRRLCETPAILASYCLAAEPMQSLLQHAYERAREGHRRAPVVLAETDRRIVSDLQQEGVHLTTLAALQMPGSAGMLEAGVRLRDRYAQMRLAGALDGRDAFQAPASDLLAEKSIFLWGLNERLLRIVEAYIGMPVAYDGINLFYTKADGRQAAARKWHLDIEDRRVLKVAVYLNDVDGEGGTFEVFRPQVDLSDWRSRARPPIFTQEKLSERFGRPLAAQEVLTCTGPAGTVIFCDTARKYHRGRPAVARDRCAVFFNFFARKPLRPFWCERGTLTRQQLRLLAQDLSPAQQAALLWWESQPLIARLVPRAPIA